MEYGFEVFHRDVEVAASFYVSVLGFRREASDGGGADHVVVRRDGLRVGCTRHPDAPTAERRPPMGCEIVLRVDDVHAEWDRVVAAGWPIADPLRTRPWGLTDFRIFDPTGQYLRITGQRREQ